MEQNFLMKKKIIKNQILAVATELQNKVTLFAGVTHLSRPYTALLAIIDFTMQFCSLTPLQCLVQERSLANCEAIFVDDCK